MSELNVSATPEPAVAMETPEEKIVVEEIGVKEEVLTEMAKDPDSIEAPTSKSESEEVEGPRGPKIALPVHGQLSEKDFGAIGVTEPVVRGLNQKEMALLPKLRAYCHSHTISLVMKSLCEQVPEAYPNYRTWEGPDPIPLIYERIQRRGHIESLWPSIRMVLKDNRYNINWTSRVIIAMTVWMVVWDLAPTLPYNTNRYSGGKLIQGQV